MRVRILALAALVGGLFVIAQFTAAIAASGPFFAWPRSDYPKGSDIAHIGHASGFITDCAINYDCQSGTSLAHSHEQDFWHHVDGEVQAAQFTSKNGISVWGATLQSYETADYAAAAFQDLVTTTTGNAPPDTFRSVTVPLTVAPDVTAVKLKLYGPVNSVTVLAAQEGNSETELGVAYPNHDRLMVQKYLNRQFKFALAQMATP